ncbi:MAG TPA: magnesium transporter [Acidimicrobiia bacterium]|nr:magnesium transporter [Acidimicrobiia bacterium]
MAVRLPPETSAPPTIALAYATQRVPIASPLEPAAAVLGRLREPEAFDSIAEVAVVEHERLIGVVRLEDLVLAPRPTPVSEIMDPDPPNIGPGADQEAAAQKAVEHQECSLAVVAEDGAFLGFIPPHRMLRVLLDEHREDLARISGYLHESARARGASEERLLRRFWHRFPWLLAGLAAAMAAAAMVSAFEQGLAAHLELAFFVPGVVYIADAIGTQTETLVVRGLSVGVSVSAVMRRELITGVALGAVLGAIAYPIVAFWFDPRIALTVSSSLLAASTVATGVAMALPWLFSALDIDPAFGSGPLATVIQDLLSLAIYFAFGTLILL